MKRFFYLLSACALLMMPSCKSGSNVNLDEVTEAGFYVAGAATGVSGLPGKLQMGPGANEKDKVMRNGMYEKYIVLEANKDFDLKLYEGGKSTRYSAILEDYTPDTSTDAYAENPTFAIQRGELKVGDDAPAMQVKKTGLYHIVLDLNLNNDLKYPQIIVVPVESWYLRGGFTDAMSPKYMTPTSVDKKSNEEIVYTFSNVQLLSTDWFKFVYSEAWKITLDIDGKVKAETSLGRDKSNPDEVTQINAENFSVAEHGKYDLVLTYKLAGGKMSNVFKLEIKQIEKLVLDPSTFEVGFSGSDLKNEDGGNWEKYVFPAVFNATESQITDAATKAGTYVFDIASVELSGEFQLRINGAWINATGATYTGLEFTGDNNLVVSKNGVYSAKISFKWDGKDVSEPKVVFTRLGDLVMNPATFAVGLSGANIKDANGKNWADYLLAGTYNATESKVTNTTNKAGTYVWDIKGAKFNGAFKVRCEGSWWGYGEVEVSGVTATDSEGNLNIAEEATYDIKITLTWDGNSMTTKKIAFTKK